MAKTHPKRGKKKAAKQPQVEVKEAKHQDESMEEHSDQEADGNSEKFEEAPKNFNKKLKLKKNARAKKAALESSSNGVSEEPAPKKARGGRATKKPSPPPVEEAEEEEVEEEQQPSPPKKTLGRRGATKKHNQLMAEHENIEGQAKPPEIVTTTEDKDCEDQPLAAEIELVREQVVAEKEQAIKAKGGKKDSVAKKNVSSRYMAKSPVAKQVNKAEDGKKDTIAKKNAGGKKAATVEAPTNKSLGEPATKKARGAAKKPSPPSVEEEAEKPQPSPPMKAYGRRRVGAAKKASLSPPAKKVRAGRSKAKQ